MTAPQPPAAGLQPWRTSDRGIGGAQWIYRFGNGYGASVVNGPYSYGGRDGLYELAVIVFHGDSRELTYDTPVTADVIGWLTGEALSETLRTIAALPAVTA